MAQKVHVLTLCDLHDEEFEGEEAVSFTVDGSAYEIDLCEEHAAALRDAFAPYVGAARRAGKPSAPAQRKSGGARTAKAAAAGDKNKMSEVREWARANGHEVSERGRIASAVLEAYETAHAS